MVKRIGTTDVPVSFSPVLEDLTPDSRAIPGQAWLLQDDPRAQSPPRRPWPTDAANKLAWGYVRRAPDGESGPRRITFTEAATLRYLLRN